MLKSFARKQVGAAPKKDPLKGREATPPQASVLTGVLTLQRLAGNRAVQRLIPPSTGGPGGAIPVNNPDDRHEQEAERAAERVMHTDASGASGAGGAATAHRGPMDVGASAGASGPGIGRHEAGHGLDPEDRQFFEARFGVDFGGVRLHSGQSAALSAQALASRAYTLGRDITFGPHEYRPRSREGRRLMAHELAHVVQQARGRGLRSEESPAGQLTPAPSHRVQRTMIATGESAGFAALANAIIAVQYEVRISRTGEVSIHSTDVQGPPTRDAQELLSTLRTVINDSNATTIEFIRGSTSTRASDRNVIVGNYALSRVDLDDVEAFGFTSSHSRMGDNAAVQLVHEITEQYRRQVHGESFPVAHRAGYAAQERLLGATLINETPMTPVGGSLGEVTTTYRYSDGREVDVITRMDFRTGQIVSVRRVVR